MKKFLAISLMFVMLSVSTVFAYGPIACDYHNGDHIMVPCGQGIVQNQSNGEIFRGSQFQCACGEVIVTEGAYYGESLSPYIGAYIRGHISWSIGPVTVHKINDSEIKYHYERFLPGYDFQ